MLNTKLLSIPLLKQNSVLCRAGCTVDVSDNILCHSYPISKDTVEFLWPTSISFKARSDSDEDITSGVSFSLDSYAINKIARRRNYYISIHSIQDRNEQYRMISYVEESNASFQSFILNPNVKNIDTNGVPILYSPCVREDLVLGGVWSQVIVLIVDTLMIHRYSSEFIYGLVLANVILLHDSAIVLGKVRSGEEQKEIIERTHQKKIKFREFL